MDAIVNVGFLALLLLAPCSTVLLPQNVVHVETYGTSPANRVKVTDVCSMHGEWVLGHQNGRVSAKNQRTGIDTWSTSIPLSRQVTSLLPDSSTSTIVALCNDGTVFVIDEQHAVNQIVTQGESITGIYRDSAVSYAFNQNGIFIIDLEEKELRPLKVLGGFANASAIQRSKNGDLLVGTSLGVLFTLRKTNDEFTKIDSVFLKIGSVVRFIVCKDGYLVETLNETCVFVKPFQNPKPWLPDFLNEEYENPNLVKLRVRDMYSTATSSWILIGTTASGFNTATLSFIVEYNYETDRFTVVRKDGKGGYYSQTTMAATDSAAIVAGYQGYSECSYGAQIVTPGKPHPSGTSAWNAITVADSRIVGGVSNADSTITTSYSLDGKTWSAATDWSAIVDVYSLNYIVPDSNGALALTLNQPLYLNNSTSTVSGCDVELSNLRSGANGKAKGYAWLNSNEGLSRYNHEDCSLVTGRPPILLDRNLAAMDDSNAVVSGMNGMVYHVSVVTDSLLYQKVEAELPIDGSQAVVSKNNGLAYCFALTRDGKPVTLLAYNNNGALVSSTDLRWADLRINQWNTVVSGTNLIGVEPNTDTTCVVDLVRKTVSRTEVVALGVPSDTPITLLGMLNNQVVLKVGTDRLAVLPLDSIVSVADYPVKSVFMTNVYPNPTSASISVNLGRNVTADLSQTTLLITNMLGSVEKQLQLRDLWPNAEFSASVQVPVADLASGPHLLVVRNHGYTESTLLQIVR